VIRADERGSDSFISLSRQFQSIRAERNIHLLCPDHHGHQLRKIRRDLQTAESKTSIGNNNMLDVISFLSVDIFDSFDTLSNLANRDRLLAHLSGHLHSILQIFEDQPRTGNLQRNDSHMYDHRQREELRFESVLCLLCPCFRFHSFSSVVGQWLLDIVYRVPLSVYSHLALLLAFLHLLYSIQP
jgi:hypothetical protein